ncbi:MAG: hypothetical protein GX936_00400, partial [Clostridiales bacterium]|nr:hypothetical protein [Clostridiales bacterium]
MKKSNLLVGLLFFLVGVACLIIGLLTQTKLDNLLFGFAGGGICGGAATVWKYYYWSRPKNKAKYREKIDAENIELADERKTKLRDKSGRYAYIIGLIVISVSIVVFSILGSLDI